MPEATNPTLPEIAPPEVASPPTTTKPSQRKPSQRKPRTPKAAQPASSSLNSALEAEDQAEENPEDQAEENPEDRAAVDEILSATQAELPETGAEVLLFLGHECGPGPISRAEVVELIEALPDELLPMLHSVTDGWPVPQGANRDQIIKRIVASGATI